MTVSASCTALTLPCCTAPKEGNAKAKDKMREVNAVEGFRAMLVIVGPAVR